MKKPFCDLCEKPALTKHIREKTFERNVKIEPGTRSYSRKKFNFSAILSTTPDGDECDICTDCLQELCNDLVDEAHKEIPLYPKHAGQSV
jgi:hypothetical protein